MKNVLTSINLEKYFSYFLIVFFMLSSCRADRLEKLKNESIWMCYESNYQNNGVICMGGYKNVDSNICFTDIRIKEVRCIGDTIEIRCESNIDDTLRACATMKGMMFDVFGFYPNVDTVCYRYSGTTISNRKSEPYDLIDHFAEWNFGFHSLKKQKENFPEFLKLNELRLNSWLRKEARRRGFL